MNTIYAGVAQWQSSWFVISRLQVRLLSPAPYAYLAQLVEQETLNFEVGGSNPSMGTIVTPLGRINHSKTWEHLFYACGRTATHGRDSSVSEFDGRVRIPVTNQMARLLKCRGPGFYPNVSPPSFGMYILSHEEGSGWVCVWSKQTPKGKIRKLFIWWV